MGFIFGAVSNTQKKRSKSVAKTNDVIEGDPRSVLETARRVNIQIRPDHLLELLKGKQLEVLDMGGYGGQPVHVVIHPPFDGVFLTHDEIDRLRLDAEMDVLRVMRTLNEPYQEEE